MCSHRAAALSIIGSVPVEPELREERGVYRVDESDVKLHMGARTWIDVGEGEFGRWDDYLRGGQWARSLGMVVKKASRSFSNIT